MLASWSTPYLGAGFLLAAAIVLFTGLRITRLVDKLADRTGIGEALAGAVLLGAATSLSGTIVSITAALDGQASLAYSNGIGGIAAQTAFLAIADLGNIFQSITLIVLLTLPLLASNWAETTVFAIHPVSLIIPIVYVSGLFATRALREKPMWQPVSTAETREDRPEPESATDRQKSTGRLFLDLALLMQIMGSAGWVIAKTAGTLTGRLELSESLVGALATAVVTSFPELVTTVAAVRRGALQLAVGGIIGGNSFDTLFLSAADISFRDGSLYHAAGAGDQFWNLTAILMTAVLLGGLVLRQRVGPARIGAESMALLGIYACAIAMQITMMSGP